MVNITNEPNHEDLKQKCLFYQVFSIYQKDNCSNKGLARPVSVLVGDGEQVDLYEFFSLVKERGGYTEVSRKRLWGSVVNGLGLDRKLCPSVKLLYDKYVNDFERWLKITLEEKKLKNGNKGCDRSFKWLSLDVEKQLTVLFCSNVKDKDNDEEFVKSNKIKKITDLVNQLDTKDKRNQSEDIQQIDDGNNKKSKGAEKEFNSHKRKREDLSLSDMLNWMKHIAKNPLDHVAQRISKPSKRKYKGQDFFCRFLRARDVLTGGLNGKPNSRRSFFQKGRVAHGHPASKKLKCRERQVSVGPHHQADISECERQVSVGPQHQADIPEWTGVVSESDSKWLGTQVWPLKHDSGLAAETDLGRGRKERCSCEFQGSVACVRLHVAQNKVKLKHELSSVFHHWGFDGMGEVVSLTWTAEEEKRFKDTMRSNNNSNNEDSNNKDSWDSPSKYFQDKTRKDLVSYYFNVFLIQLRSYQNRVTPKNVDSDDDEKEFGSLSHGFSLESVGQPGDNFLECSLNEQEQYTDLE